VTVEPSDEQLLEATARGDEEAFVEIYRRYRDRVYRYACRMTGSAEAAHDITHACFASLLSAPRRFKPQGAALGTYLCAAARNQSLRRLRLARREPVASFPLDHRRAPDRGPLDRLLDDEMGRKVRSALQALAPLHREVVILADYEELDMATIAEIVGADVGAVRVRLHRARRKLRRALEDYVIGAEAQGVRK
jgi:RNA polymerase sigma-70 factor (ECF subfamily)